MPSIRIRKPFAGAFAALVLISAYLGLSTQKIPQYGQSDKGLHFITFFLLTITFYFILEAPRRRVLHLTLLLVTAGLGIGSEIAQALLPNGRDFDPYDILANVLGSAGALLICNWYHKRMLERRRANKNYDIVPGEDEEGVIGEGERDVELGEGVGLGAQETGVTVPHENGQAGGGVAKTNVTEELDNWDENMDDEWEEEGAEAAKVTAGVGAEEEPDKKRTD